MEEDFKLGKGCFGLDQCQTRLYTAILRHLVLVMAALAVCAVTAAQLRDCVGPQARSRWFHKRARLARNYPAGQIAIGCSGLGNWGVPRTRGGRLMWQGD